MLERIHIGLRQLGFISSMVSLYAIMLLFVMASFQMTPFVKTVTPIQASVQIRPKPDQPPILSGTAARLHIPSLSIDKTIEPGEYIPESNSWTLSDSGIHHATMTAPPNDHSGTTFIYGHNNRYTFGPLLSIQKGAVAVVYTNNNLKFSYKFERTQALNPSDTSVLEYTPKPQLLLQTCSGNWFEKRQMFYFSLTSVERV